ncbi:DNA polymerase IV [Fodinicurvata halophila]|uniref:DNA polymerase IV n=1 Tax=Fodinicurvata halophila TaxID=1419723 RepID=UPI00363D1130
MHHTELESLSFAHLDCDAFYASVEKRDRPELRDKPVIVGGGQRGVVSAACYVARLYGVRSAMPMFKALSLCPDAEVLRPDMAKYREVSRAIRDRMSALTPQIEPLSLDEAFLDLSGTSRLHRASPAECLARLAADIERDLAVSVSIGLSTCKLLAKIASDLDKPRGFAVIGASEAADFLADKPVSILWGVGSALQKKLLSDGIRLVRDLRPYEESELMARYGAMGRRLHLFARGQDPRPIEADAPAKSLSSETTFEQDIQDLDSLQHHLWPLCEKLARRLRDKDVAGKTVTLKLRTGDFRLQTRSRQLFAPTQSAETLYEMGHTLLRENWKPGAIA